MKYELNKMIPIEVTRDDIDNGIRNQLTCCPIALAVCRALNELSDSQLIEVSDVISLLNEKVTVRAICPFISSFRRMSIAEWVVAFDKEETVLPFTFSIEIFEEEEDDYEE